MFLAPWLVVSWNAMQRIDTSVTRVAYIAALCYVDLRRLRWCQYSLKQFGTERDGVGASSAVRVKNNYLFFVFRKILSVTFFPAFHFLPFLPFCAPFCVNITKETDTTKFPYISYFLSFFNFILFRQFVKHMCHTGEQKWNCSFIDS